jgi:hypothetical protein
VEETEKAKIKKKIKEIDEWINWYSAGMLPCYFEERFDLKKKKKELEKTLQEYS